ncbi:MAG: hypothetical protein LBD48_01405, partial [Treponema sp.]|nr:hypothetical protein [Treponema sp.]
VTATFEKLTAELADHNTGVITFTSGKEPKTEEINSDTDPHFEEVKEFIECVKKGRQTGCGILEGYKSLCFVETVVRSAKLDGAKLAVDAKY